MATPKASTLQQKLGFKDEDLKTPKHDEMMLWLHENMLEFLTNNQLWTPKISTQADFEKRRRDAQENDAAGAWRTREAWKVAKYDNMPPLPSARDQIYIEWEHAITSGANKYMIGFIDMLVKTWDVWDYCYSDLSGWGVYAPLENVLCIEIKTKIPSLGELIRQVRTYQSHVKYHNCKWLVVCPDDRFKEPLASQGITLIKYTGSTP